LERCAAFRSDPGLERTQQEEIVELETLTDLYIDELKDLYSAENQILKALPKMAQAASNPQLQAAFSKHLEQTQGQVERLKKIAANMRRRLHGKKCVAMEGLLKEGDELMHEDAEPAVLDAGLIAAAQRVEHYEIAGYGCVRTYAKLLGDEEAVSLLQETLNEEGQTDQALTKLAESVINVEAGKL